MDALDRLYRRLAEAIRREQPTAGGRSLTIAEIYQHLVPYRAVRSDLGFSELAEYEHTLLRLLGGERGYVSVDVAQAGDDFRRELRSSNPILGLYRDYAAVGVHVDLTAAPAPPDVRGDGRAEEPEDAAEGEEEALPLLGVSGAEPAADAPSALPAAAAGPADQPRAGQQPPRDSARPAAAATEEPREQERVPDQSTNGRSERPNAPTALAEPPQRQPAPEPETREPQPAELSPPITAASTGAPEAIPRRTSCRICREALPEGRDIRFCPFCGESQHAVPCRECSTPLEPEWSFCILCGEPRRAAAQPS